MQCADAICLAAGYYTALGHGALDAFAADVTTVLENFKAAAKRSGLEVTFVMSHHVHSLTGFQQSLKWRSFGRFRQLLDSDDFAFPNCITMNTYILDLSCSGIGVFSFCLTIFLIWWLPHRLNQACLCICVSDALLTRVSGRTF